MENNTVSRNKDLYPIDDYLVPAVIGNSNNINYLQLSDFQGSSSVENLVVPSGGSLKLSEPKNGKSKSKDLPKSIDLLQTKSSNTAKDSPSTQDQTKSTEGETKIEEIDRLMQVIKKQIMQIELNIPKMQAEAMMKIESGLSGNDNFVEFQKVQKDASSINDKNIMRHQETKCDHGSESLHANQCSINSFKWTCLCCSKPMKRPSSYKHSEIKGSGISKDAQFEKKNSYYSHKQSPMKKYQQFYRDSNECEKTSNNIGDQTKSVRSSGEVRNDGKEYVEMFVMPECSKNDCSLEDESINLDHSKPNNSFDSHGSDVRNMRKLNYIPVEGLHRTPEEFIDNEVHLHVPQLVTRPKSQYGSSARLDTSNKIEQDEEMCSRMGSASKKRNEEMNYLKPNAAVHRVVSQESSTSAQNKTLEMHHQSNSKLGRLNKALLPGVDIRSELSVQPGPTVHIPAVSKFAVSSEKNKNVLLKEFVHVETEREIISGTSRTDTNSKDEVVKNNIDIGNKYGVQAASVKRLEGNFKSRGELLHPQTSQSSSVNVVNKRPGEGLNNNEVQEHLYNAVRTYANKLNSQNKNSESQKQLKETLQELSFNISRLYNNQMNEYVQCGRSRDVQAPLSYRMKAVAELLWEELELRTYPSEEHYSQIEEIINHLVHDLEDAIKEDIPLKTAIKEDFSMKTNQPKTGTHTKNAPLKNIHLVEDLMTKWKDIKDAFLKDYKLQLMSSDSDNNSSTRRNKYVITDTSPSYDQMLFLLPYVKSTPTITQQIEPPETSENVALSEPYKPEIVVIEENLNELKTSTATQNVIVCNYVNGSNISTPSHNSVVCVNGSKLMSTPNPAKSIKAHKALVITRKRSLSPRKILQDRIVLEKNRQELSTIKAATASNQKEKTVKMGKENKNPDQYGHEIFLNSFAPVLYNMPLHKAMQVRKQISEIISNHFSQAD